MGNKFRRSSSVKYENHSKVLLPDVKSPFGKCSQCQNAFCSDTYVCTLCTRVLCISCIGHQAMYCRVGQMRSRGIICPRCDPYTCISNELLIKSLLKKLYAKEFSKCQTDLDMLILWQQKEDTHMDIIYFQRKFILLRNLLYEYLVDDVIFIISSYIVEYPNRYFRTRYEGYSRCIF